MPENTARRYRFEDLKGFCIKAYTSVGVPADEAEIVSDLLVRSDLRGVQTHGVMRLPIYIQRLQKDYVRKACQFEVIRRKGATAHVQAHGSQGHMVAHQAMTMAMEMADAYGIGWVAVRDSGHFGVAGLFPMMTAARGLIGFICSNSAPMMAPYGGRDRIIGNNPLAYAFPAARHEPVVVDFSCTVVASGRLILMRKKGEKIPLGWAVDKDGLPTEDPYAGYEGGGSLAPMGGHKGYGLALAHEMLTAILTGGKITRNIKSLYEVDESGVQGTCHTFLAVDPDAFIGREPYKEAVSNYIDMIRSSGRAKGVERILMPGEPEAITEADCRDRGIPLPEATVNDLRQLATSLDLSFIDA